MASTPPAGTQVAADGGHPDESVNSAAILVAFTNVTLPGTCQ